MCNTLRPPTKRWALWMENPISLQPLSVHSSCFKTMLRLNLEPLHRIYLRLLGIEPLETRFRCIVNGWLGKSTLGLGGSRGKLGITGYERLTSVYVNFHKWVGLGLSSHTWVNPHMDLETRNRYVICRTVSKCFTILSMDLITTKRGTRLLFVGIFHQMKLSKIYLYTIWYGRMFQALLQHCQRLLSLRLNAIRINLETHWAIASLMARYLKGAHTLNLLDAEVSSLTEPGCLYRLW